MMRVGEYLALPRPKWDWVNLDCCRWVDRWVVLRGHDSPMRAIGIHYDSEMSALRQIARGGGLVRLWSSGMAAADVLEVASPLPGDVAVIHRATIDRVDEAMAIFTGQRWASLGLRGLDIAPADPLRIWRP